MSGENNIEFKPEPDNRGTDILKDKARANPRDPAQSPESIEAVRTVASQAPQSTENPLAPQSTQIPALPILSSFFGATEAVTADTVKGAVMDALKNVTINGVSPNINGGSIDFNVETKPSASQQWNQANGINNSVLISPTPTLTPTPTPLINYPTETDTTLINQLVPTLTSSSVPTPTLFSTTTPDQSFTTQEQNQKIEDLKVEIPKVYASSKAEDSKVEDPKVDVPKVEVPKVEVPKVEVPKVEVPKVDDPKVEDPKVEASKVDTPKVDTPKVDTPKVDTPKVNIPAVETPEIDISMFSMAKPKTLKERVRELEEERDADSGVFSMAKPKSLKVDSGRNTIDDVIDQAESESKAVSSGEKRRGKDRIFDRIEEAIENEDYDKARKLNEQVKNRELETELRGEGKDRDRRSTKDIAEAEGIDTRGKSNKELREEILEKRRDAQEKADTRPTTEIQSIEVGKEVVQIIPVPVKRADDTDYRMIYVMAKSAVNLETDKSPPETLESPDNDDSFTNQEYWVPLGGGSGGNHPFKVSVKSGTDSSYKVFLRSSIVNGINGGPFTITGLNEDKPLSTEKFIIAEADVTFNPFKISDSGFTIKEVDAADTDEVKLEDNKQTKIRLLIAKITVEDMEGGGKALSAWQAVTTSFRAAVSFHNGTPVYILQSAPTHQSSI